MPRKIFLSFLGVSNYDSVCYGRPGDVPSTIAPTRFIQEAVIRAYCSDFTENDQVLVFTTKAALKNWEDGEHYNRKKECQEFHEGLKTRLEKLNLMCSINNKLVEDGSTKEEIWKIFEAVYDVFEQGDEVYFDITHGFRSLPMLNLVLINYAKLLKNVTVKGIFYGAFEGRKELDGILFAPIWELTDFAKLQDWTNSASMFLKTGNASALVEQIGSAQYRNIRDNLESFSEFTLGNRGVDLYQGNTMVALRQALAQEIEPNDPAFKALQEILNKIRSEFDDYQTNSAINGLLAVRWCIHNGLIQQASTLLEEFITTFVLEELGQIKHLQDYKVRTTISAALGVDAAKFDYGKKEGEELALHKKLVEQVNAYPHRKKLSKLVNKVKQSLRNDINHGGFRESPRSFKKMSASIRKRYNEMAAIVKKIRNTELPKLEN